MDSQGGEQFKNFGLQQLKGDGLSPQAHFSIQQALSQGYPASIQQLGLAQQSLGQNIASLAQASAQSQIHGFPNLISQDVPQHLVQQPQQQTQVQTQPDRNKTGQKRKRQVSSSSRKRRKIDPKDKRYKEIIVRFIFRNLDRPIHSTYVSKCATHKKNSTIVKDIFWELDNKGYGKAEKWRDTENSSLFFYKNEALNEKSEKYDEAILNRLTQEYNLEKSDVADGFRIPTKGPAFKKRINTGRWSKEEHEAFLRGLSEYGRTNYRLIAQNYVKTRITQQVAEYSERYFAAKRKKEKDRAQQMVSTPPPPPPTTMGLLPQQIMHLQHLQQMAVINPQFAQQFQSQISALQQQVSQFQQPTGIDEAEAEKLMSQTSVGQPPKHLGGLNLTDLGQDLQSAAHIQQQINQQHAAQLLQQQGQLLQHHGQIPGPNPMPFHAEEFKQQLQQEHDINTLRQQFSDEHLRQTELLGHVPPQVQLGDLNPDEYVVHDVDVTKKQIMDDVLKKDDDVDDVVGDDVVV